MANAAITIDLNAKIAQFETELKKATGSLDRFEKKGSQVAAGFKTAMGSLAAVVSVGALAGFIKQNIDAQDAISKLSQKTGIAVESLAGLQHAADLSDVAVDQLAKGVRTFSVTVDEAARGSKSYQDKLAGLGIDFKKIKDLKPEDQFYELADAVSRLSKEDRAAAVAGALGDRMSVLVPLLSGGADGLRQMVDEGKKYNPVTEESARLAEEFNDNLTRLKASAGAAGVSIATDLLPSLAATADRVRELMDEDKGVQALVRAFAGIGKIPFDLIFGDIKAASTAQERIKELKTELGGLERDLKSALPGGDKSSIVLRAIFGQPEDIKREITVIRNQIEAFEKYGDKYKTRAKAPDTSAAGSGALPSISGGSKSKSDPLAGLLGSTDIGKLAAFDKQVALLNARFDGGRKSTELYSQAMTKLVETTFSANFSEFNKQLSEQDETQRLVAEHLKSTNDAIYEQQQAWIEVGQALEDEMRTPLENANIEFGRLQDLLDRGVISWETYARAVMKVQDAIEETPDKFKEMDNFAKQFAENAQDTFADFFKNFDKGTDGMLQQFGEMVKGLVAEAVAADLAKYLFGDLVKDGKGSGAVGSLFSMASEFFGFADGGIAAYGRPVALPRFAGGGVSNSAAIFGEAGPEAAVPLPDGRRIPVEMRGGGGHTINVYVSGSNNAPDVRRAAGQGAREALGMFNSAQRYS